MKSRRQFIFWSVLYVALIVGFGYFRRDAVRTKPSDLLGFKPPTRTSLSIEIRTIQAELCRHGIECAIDGDYGKQTALGVCELLDKIEKGYKVKSIYEGYRYRIRDTP